MFECQAPLKTKRDVSAILSRCSSKKFAPEDATKGVAQGHRRVTGIQLIIFECRTTEEFLVTFRGIGTIGVANFQEKVNSEPVLDGPWIDRK
jgi:hypothetical protein